MDNRIGASYGDMVIHLKDGEKEAIPLSPIDRIAHAEEGDPARFFTPGFNLRTEGKYREAIIVFSHALAGEPDGGEIFTSRGRSYSRRKD